MPAITAALSQLVIDVALTGPPTRGDLLYANSTPKWTRLAVGAANRVLGSDGTDPAWVAQSFLDHGSVSGLSDDDHTGYALLAGRSGGQTLQGDTASGGDLTLQSTAHATKGQIFFGANAYYDQAASKFVSCDADISTVNSNLLPPNTGDIGPVGTGAVGFKATRVSSSGVTAPQWALRRARGTLASPTAAASGDSLGFLLFQGYETTTPSFKSGVGITATTEEAFTSTANGCQMVFSTAAVGAASRTNRLGLSANGNVIIGDIVTPTALATTATDGFLYIPSCAGAATGTPTSYSPLCPIVFDTTNNRLYIYDPVGATWHYIAVTA